MIADTDFVFIGPFAELQEVKIAREWPCKPGGLAHSLRFDPVASNTSGLFVARIIKEAQLPTILRTIPS